MDNTDSFLLISSPNWHGKRLSTPLLVFLFEIVFPTNLDNQRKELIKKILPKRKKEDDSNLECYQLEKTNIDIKPPNMKEEYEDINQNECVQQ